MVSVFTDKVRMIYLAIQHRCSTAKQNQDIPNSLALTPLNLAH